MTWSAHRTSLPAELVTLPEAKNHLRVDVPDDDALIARQVTAATRWVEENTGRQLVTAEWRLTLDAPCPIIELPRPPLQEVTAVTVHPDDGAAIAVDVTDWVVDTASSPGRLATPRGYAWPTHRSVAAIEVDYVAGYGAASDVPEPIVQATLLIVGTMYEHRESVVTGVIATALPQSVEWLLSPYRIRGF